MPAAVHKLLPSSMTGGGPSDKSSYVLETSVVDIREGWMRTESRNLNFTGVLSVVEQQHFNLPTESARASSSETDVTTTVIFKSKIGEKLRGKLDQAQRSDGWFSGLATGWGANRIGRSIESLASTKTEDQIGRSRDGMRHVLERIRNTGVIGVLETLRRERQLQGSP